MNGQVVTGYKVRKELGIQFGMTKRIDAMKRFEGTNTIENYLDYSTLEIALECVVSEMDRFVNKDWK